MKKWPYLPSLVLLLSLTVMSCEHDFEVDVPRTTQNVILANFTPEEQMKVYISSTVPIGNIDSSSMKYPPNAQVSLYANGAYEDKLIYTPGHNGTLPYYRSSSKVSPAVFYEIEVDVEGKSISSASNRVPKGLESIESEIISIDEIADTEFPELVTVRANVLLTIEDNTSGESYFHLKGSAFEESVNGISVINELDHLKILHEEGVLVKIPDFNTSDRNIQIEVEFYYFPNFESKEHFNLEVRKCSRDYYLFHRSVGEQELSNFRDGILSSQSVQIHNNIIDGVGNFSSYTTHDHRVEW